MSIEDPCQLFQDAPEVRRNISQLKTGKTLRKASATSFRSDRQGGALRQNSMQFEEAGQLRVMPLQVIAQPVCWQLPEVLWHFQ